MMTLSPATLPATTSPTLDAWGTVARARGARQRPLDAASLTAHLVTHLVTLATGDLVAALVTMPPAWRYQVACAMTDRATLGCVRSARALVTLWGCV